MRRSALWYFVRVYLFVTLAAVLFLAVPGLSWLMYFFGGSSILTGFMTFIGTSGPLFALFSLAWSVLGFVLVVSTSLVGIMKEKYTPFILFAILDIAIFAVFLIHKVFTENFYGLGEMGLGLVCRSATLWWVLSCQKTD